MAARCRVASRSDAVSAGMSRIRAAKDRDGRTFFFLLREELGRLVSALLCYPLYRHRCQIVNNIDSLQSLRNLPFHRMQSGLLP